MKFEAKIAVALLTLASVSAQADVVYSLAWDGSGIGTLSTQDTSPPANSYGDFSQAWSPFSFSAATTVSATITGLTWNGSYDPGISAQNPGFYLQVWSATSAGGVNTAAGPLVNEYVASASETFVNNTVDSATTAASENYSYSAVLPASFTATAGVDYFLTIQAGIVVSGVAGNSNPVEPVWYWSTASNGDGNSYYNYGGTIYQPNVPTPYAFSLIGSTVPAAVPVPSAIWLFGTMLAGFGLSRKKSAV